MSRLSGVFQKPESRMKAVLIMLAVVVLAGLCFILFENKRNREIYLDMYRDRQQVYTGQLEKQLVHLVAEGADEAAVCSWLSEQAEVSANSWSFCARGELVLFAKDKKTTENLREEKKWDEFLRRIESQDAIVTMIENKQSGYTLGTITAESYALTQGGVQQHEIYLELLFAILVMLAAMAIIGVTAKLNQVEKNLSQTSHVMRRQNRKLEKSGEKQLTGEEAASEPEQETQEFYDSELIRMFLKKSEDEALMPMQILFANITMESRYYTRKEIFDALGKLKEFLGSTHVIGEIRKGSFVVLMYRTTKEQAALIVKNYEESMRQVTDSGRLPMQLSVVEVTEERPAQQVYEDYLKGGDET